MPNDLHPVPTDPSSLAAAGFLARYRKPTVSAYRNDLRCYWAWCAQHELQPLQAQRAHLGLYLRDLHSRGYAPATISRRLSTVAGLFRYAVIAEVVTKNPTSAVTRPKVQWGPATDCAAPAGVRVGAHGRARVQPHRTCARRAAPMLGLRVSEACQVQVTDLQYTGGYQVLHVLGKGSKPADIPLPVPVLRRPSRRRRP